FQSAAGVAEKPGFSSAHARQRCARKRSVSHEVYSCWYWSSQNPEHGKSWRIAAQSVSPITAVLLTIKQTKLEMKILIKNCSLTSAALMAACFLCGCAFTKDYVSLSYAPQANVPRIQGAEGVLVNVDVAD